MSGLSFSMNGTTRQRLESAAHNLVDYLNDVGVPAYIHYMATTGSSYIRFRNCHVCRQLRISDHPGKTKYRFKYNLFLNEVGYRAEVDGNVTRFYYGINETGRLIDHLKEEYRRHREGQ